MGGWQATPASPPLKDRRVGVASRRRVGVAIRDEVPANKVGHRRVGVAILRGGVASPQVLSGRWDKVDEVPATQRAQLLGDQRSRPPALLPLKERRTLEVMWNLIPK